MIAQIRPFLDKDFFTLLQIDRACFEPGIAYDEAALRHFVYQISSRTLVLVVDSKVAGFGISAMTWGRGGRRTGHIITLDLLPEVRGLGHGRLLLRRLEEELTENGTSQVTLEVDVRNRGAIAFYRKMGYKEERQLKDYYGRGRDGLRMVCNLPPAE